jgi:phage-related protein
MKPLAFIGSSKQDLAEFPPDVRRIAGHELWQIQCGLLPSDFKPMSSVGAGCYEIRIHRAGEWRVIYVAKFAGAVYVLHAFRKKTRTTAASDVMLARRRFLQIDV